ncbi:MAG: hypothetical protein L0H65_18815, partial [Pseudorhodobacter sp.]|nr:hypothetical protein [Pseudorhodobacter sp.]
MTKKVLLVGWHPSVVNYAKWPGMTPEKLELALRADESKLNALGYDAAIGFIHSGETAVDQVVESLKSA